MNAKISESSFGTRKLVTLSLLAAVAYAAMYLIHLKLVPAADFLTYDPKDAVISMGGFIFGPSAVLIISIAVSFLEMITVSTTGIIGFAMNVMATLSFAGTAALFYKKVHSKKSAVIGLITGTILMTIVMVLWNYLLTPLYLGSPREDVVKLLVPAIVPFNILKGTANSVIVLLLYKPVITALRRSGFLLS